MNFDQSIDVSQFSCPIPIVKTSKKIKAMQSGQILEIIASDEGIKIDLPAWCETTGHELVEIIDGENGLIRVYVRVKASN